MSIPVSNDLTSEVAPTREQTLSVSRSNVWIHVCDITIVGMASVEYKPEHLLPADFLEGKGQVSLLSMTVKAALDVAQGSVAIGVASVNNSYSGLAGVRTIPNRFILTANSMNVGTELVSDLVIPTGVARQIYPTSSALPAPAILIASNAKASGYVTIVMEVSCTGPFLSSKSIVHGTTA